MIKTKLFTEIKSLEAIRNYEKFISENQNINIISVNTVKHDFIILTYEDIKRNYNQAIRR